MRFAQLSETRSRKVELSALQAATNIGIELLRAGDIIGRAVIVFDGVDKGCIAA